MLQWILVTKQTILHCSQQQGCIDNDSPEHKIDSSATVAGQVCVLGTLLLDLQRRCETATNYRVIRKWTRHISALLTIQTWFRWGNLASNQGPVIALKQFRSLGNWCFVQLRMSFFVRFWFRCVMKMYVWNNKIVGENFLMISWIK